MTVTDPTDRIIAQGRTLVWAIEALGTIEPSGPFERALAELFQAAYERCLRAIVAEAPPWVSEEILSSREHVQDGQPAAWVDMSDQQSAVAHPATGSDDNSRTGPERPESRQAHTLALTTRKRKGETPTLPI